MSARRPTEETARLGKEIYEHDIRPRLRETHHGEYVAIDMDSGSHVVADTRLVAAERLLAQHPDAGVWLERVGHRAVVSIGGGSYWPGRRDGSASARMRAARRPGCLTLG